ncbi:MAG: NHL repeat-containing protein, partial [Roseiflexaceae bacterium]|nr:NHL repeat-containing protein [Roseiflexaceae bacterium]
EIEELAINQTRRIRTTGDPDGGNTMPVIMDIGGESGDGSLAWPFQWYLRDFQRLESRNADFFANADAQSFAVQKPGAPDGTTELAPVVLVSSSHVTDQARQALEQNYAKRYDSMLNWWFPEGDLTGCNPETPGYKQFYYSTLSLNRARLDTECASVIETAQYAGPLAPVTWLFDRAHWADTFRFVIWRELPEPLRIDGREMQVWVRKDLAPSAGAVSDAGGSATGTLRLLAEQSYGVPGSESGALNEPRGVAVDAQGNLYVADTGNNRVNIYDSQGTLLRSFGSFGTGEGQFNEPRGIALDAAGNIYVADTWNARIAKFDNQGNFLAAWGTGNQDFGNGRVATATDRTQAGNAAAPLGLFGPRGVAVDAQGYVYIADTGNRRIVVTDGQGNFRYQWGYEGSGDGQFNEPISVAVDAEGKVYVADVWNGRVQVFSPAQETQNVSELPSAVWDIAGWDVNSYDDPYLSAAADGTVYLTVPSRNQALALNSNGETLLRWGGVGSDFTALNLPSGIALGADGRVFIADRGNGRVMEFDVPAVAPPLP